MATGTRRHIAKATAATGELTDIQVLEVSPVDAAANKRRWLAVKSADSSADGSVAPDDGATPAEPAAPSDPAAEVVTAEVTPEQQVIDSTAAAALAASPEPEPVIDPPSEPIVPQGEVIPVEKRGAKMAKKRLERLEASHAEIGKILKELRDDVDAEDDATKSGVAKAVEPNPLAPQVEALTKSEADLRATVEKQAKNLESAKQAIAKQADIIAKAKLAPEPNSKTLEGDDTEKSAKPFRWPY